MGPIFPLMDILQSYSNEMARNWTSLPSGVGAGAEDSPVTEVM